MVVQRVLDAPGTGGPDVLIDLQSVPEVRGGFGVAISDLRVANDLLIDETLDLEK